MSKVYTWKYYIFFIWKNYQSKKIINASIFFRKEENIKMKRKVNPNIPLSIKAMKKPAEKAGPPYKFWNPTPCPKNKFSSVALDRTFTALFIRTSLSAKEVKSSICALRMDSYSIVKMNTIKRILE